MTSSIALNDVMSYNDFNHLGLQVWVCRCCPPLPPNHLPAHDHHPLLGLRATYPPLPQTKGQESIPGWADCLSAPESPARVDGEVYFRPAL